ncbi:retroviral-like aspartic protease family protein [Croceibacterium sp. LX-88]|uniref:Retroviral-like aspartic protease family protein n=1 Tax=Croceibacterium selenioxidans TaxID=2838833 RepID=A0ABS5W6S7_9SPHN|nr:retropepsin-like aspartic protease [Croceibacterium selenioxidans]MBT2135052.1 retroviral-like aspartic protease family protein [Croceibacterium selenioxidans]
MGWQHLAAAITLVTGLSGASAQESGDDIPEVEIINLEDERYRRMTVPVTIGENGPFQFMIDTGAQATVVSRDLADRLQLFDRDEATLVGMASRRQVETTPIADVRLGSRNFYIENAPVIEGEHIGGADGILGLDSLQNQRVLIDFIKKEMSVADADQLGGNRGFEIIVKARSKLGQLIITSARLDGIPVAVIVDTGAQGSIGNPALQARLRRGRHLGETELTDINGVAMAGTIRIANELDLGRAKLSNLAVMFADSPSFHSLGLSDRPALVLGMSELKLFRRVAIDFQSRRVLFDMPRGS